MQKSKIEWTDYTINPVKGLCPMACPYCYARAMYKRFKWNPEIRFDGQPLLDIEKIKKPSRIFVGSTIELFGEWVDTSWFDSIFRTVKDNLHHTFIFLTKQPQNLRKFSPFPSNCFVGVSATNIEQYRIALAVLAVIEAKIKYISFEPLLQHIPISGSYGDINWVIIGAQTKPYKPPRREWVQEIVEAADKMGIPIFLKDNLWALLYTHAFENSIFWATDKAKLRQEMPMEGV